MKKILCVLLSALMLLSLCACGTSGTASDGTGSAQGTTASGAASGLTVGYGKANITPEESVPLAGYGNSTSRMSVGMLDYLYATCLAVSDGSNTVLLFAMDLPNMYNPLPKFRSQLADEVGLPVEKVMLCCSHTHSGPDLKQSQISAQASYNSKLYDTLVELAEDTLADMKPVTGMFVTTTETQGMNFVRRYILENGTYAGDNYGDFSSSPIAGHETEVDNTLQLLKFTREGGKDVILTNFQTHPHRTGGSKKYDISADIVGIYRQTLEEALDCNAMYFSGSSGNVNPTSRIDEENITADYKEHGKTLAQYAIDAIPTLKEIQPGKVSNLSTIYVGQVNHTEDHLVPYASTVVARWENGATFKESIAGYESYGINSPYHASSIVTKSTLPNTMDVELNGISIGDFSLVFAPFELYDELGVSIKEGSPFEMTFVCCYANDLFSYMPTQTGFDHGGYGPNQCKFIPGTGEILVSEYLTILNTLYAEK